MGENPMEGDRGVLSFNYSLSSLYISQITNLVCILLLNQPKSLVFSSYGYSK